MNVLATGPQSWFTTGTSSCGPSSPWKSPSAITVMTRIGISSENTSALRSRKKIRRSLRKTASMVRTRDGSSISQVLPRQFEEDVVERDRRDARAEDAVAETGQRAVDAG
jgi:hypothetical protein